MAYKYAKGKIYRGDIYNEDDTQRNTFIDFSEDAVGIIVGNTEGLVVSGSGAVSSSLNVSASGFYGDGSGLSGITATASPAGSDGQIQYNNGGSTGGAGSLYWHDSNNRLGIGTSNPSRQLDIEGADNALIQFNATNYRAYSMGSDAYGFTIFDDSTGGIPGYRFVISDQADALGYVGIGAGASIAGSNHPDALLHLSSSDDGQIFRADTTDGTAVLFATGSNRVGIGTSSPDYTLDVAGNAGFDEYLYHNGDADTFIRLEDDTISLAAGGRTFIKIEEASQDKMIINHGALDIDLKVGGENQVNLIRTCAEFDKVGICYAPDSTDDHELTIVGNVSASLNVSASAFYGDGSGLSGVATAIHDPWVSGSTDTYKRLMSTTGSIDIDGYGFTDGSTVSFDSQFDTDGHAAGALTFNSPVSLDLVVSASGQTGSYDMTISNTDGLSYTVTNGLQVAGTVTTNIDGNHKVAANRTNTTYTTVYGFGPRSGFIRTNTGFGWNSGAVTLAEITDGSSGYIEFMPTADQLVGDYYMIGLAYSGSNPAASNNYTEIDYALYCYEGGQTAPYYLIYESGTERSAARAQIDFSEDRLFRVEVIDDTVKYRYSDDHGDSWTDLYTSGVSVDIAGNGHLVGMFAIYKTGADASTMATRTCIENIKVNGVLTNYE
jgi:hypothetical protein